MSAQVGKATYHNAARPFLPPSYLLLVSSLFLYHDVRLKADDNINGQRSVRRRERATPARLKVRLTFRMRVLWRKPVSKLTIRNNQNLLYFIQDILYLAL